MRETHSPRTAIRSVTDVVRTADDRTTKTTIIQDHAARLMSCSVRSSACPLSRVAESRSRVLYFGRGYRRGCEGGRLSGARLRLVSCVAVRSGRASPKQRPREGQKSPVRAIAARSVTGRITRGYRGGWRVVQTSGGTASARLGVIRRALMILNALNFNDIPGIARVLLRHNTPRAGLSRSPARPRGRRPPRW